MIVILVKLFLLHLIIRFNVVFLFHSFLVLAVYIHCTVSLMLIFSSKSTSMLIIINVDIGLNAYDDDNVDIDVGFDTYVDVTININNIDVYFYVDI